MQENELRVVAVDIRANDKRLGRYCGTAGIFVGIARLGEAYPADTLVTATIRAKDAHGNVVPPIAIYRANDDFSTTAPKLTQHCTIAFASLESYCFRMESFAPCIAEVFSALGQLARHANAAGTMRDVDLALECDGNPRLTFTIYRRLNDVILRVEQSKPRVTEA